MKRNITSRWLPLAWVMGGVCVLLSAVPAVAQLSESDIAALRERGQKEGWTFDVGESEATQRPISQLCGVKEPPDWRERSEFDACTPTRDLPTKFNWRTQWGSKFPAIRNQAQCGACWAFGAIGAMECAMIREANNPQDLSEQWLVSCTTAGDCSGGWHTTALDYLKSGGLQDACGGNGAVLESAFPYQAANTSCYCPYSHPYALHSWFLIGSFYGTPTVEQIKQAIYDHGPVAVCIYVNDAFQAYRSGVFNACESASINHVVLLIGWDDTQGAGGVWILRNQWGTSWGESGYMRITYGCCRVGYAAAYVNFLTPDCNHNGTPDVQDIAAGTSKDCNHNEIPDECETGGGTDCDNDGSSDLCEIFNGTSADCDTNGIPDACEIAAGTAIDCNTNGVLDTCELDVSYQVDDGSTEINLGTPEVGQIIWLNTFTVRTGGETINAIDIAWGSVPTGT